MLILFSEAENCTVPSSLKRCYPIPWRNSCLKLEHSNQSSNWFSSASACERDGGRLLWLFHQNVQTFMNQNTKSIKRTDCPNCTFLWIGLMQSTLHDDNFFWKRTQNGRLSSPLNVFSYAFMNITSLAFEKA